MSQSGGSIAFLIINFWLYQQSQETLTRILGTFESSVYVLCLLYTC